MQLDKFAAGVGALGPMGAGAGRLFVNPIITLNPKP